MDFEDYKRESETTTKPSPDNQSSNGTGPRTQR